MRERESRRGNSWKRNQRREREVKVKKNRTTARKDNIVKSNSIL